MVFARKAGGRGGCGAAPEHAVTPAVGVGVESCNPRHRLPVNRPASLASALSAGSVFCSAGCRRRRSRVDFVLAARTSFWSLLSTPSRQRDPFQNFLTVRVLSSIGR
ncbi:hypothetical protein TELCIR_01016 [Teladorsagia circumcincta]|uniref:Uncharacterized protein n=1 Tax=Teladorsagia circumcincta TaxID=45464 RepID=A0A2G9V341_TELCI|nr:hypothetical protein TELCIR_01016 [Teladorsagia circumcincta]